ncbi:hypothetical protein BD310DRAFT_442480 [Dichomitus squalens]|uniref:Uncharacterized protein n=1 Tax=Dichomitus squalens TaxID=114155 RepID=A0A4Q9PWD3_9APHY|nr:hypothetical protein BD310DRAFT_442480 [Dichomitus squalens]
MSKKSPQYHGWVQLLLSTSLQAGSQPRACTTQLYGGNVHGASTAGMLPKTAYVMLRSALIGDFQQRTRYDHLRPALRATHQDSLHTQLRRV